MLQELGITDCDFEPHLDSLIFQIIGLDDDDDNVSDKYFDIMERRSKTSGTLPSAAQNVICFSTFSWAYKLLKKNRTLKSK